MIHLRYIYLGAITVVYEITECDGVQILRPLYWSVS